MDKIFADGMRFDIPTKAPEWVKGRLSIKIDEFVAFLEKNRTQSGWITIDLKKSKGDKYYAELSQWKPEKPEFIKEQEKKIMTEPSEDFPEGLDVKDIPF